MAFTLTVLFAVSVTTTQAAANSNPGVYPPHSNPYGKSYGEWAGIFWQWLLSFPADASPAFEQGEVIYGVQKQSGPLWILESGNVGVWERQVRIPAGRGLLFSITGAACDTLSMPDTRAEELVDCVNAPFNDLTIFAFAEVDGIPMTNVDRYLVTSPLFDINVPENGLFGIPTGRGTAIEKGWFFILAPLSKGQHTIRVRAHIVEAPEFDGETTYQLTVE
jgi:hypothetical protein